MFDVHGRKWGRGRTYAYIHVNVGRCVCVGGWGGEQGGDLHIFIHV